MTRSITIRSTSDIDALAYATAEAFKEAKRLVELDIKEQSKTYNVNIYQVKLFPAYWDDNGNPQRSFSLTAVTRRRLH